jgi:NAD(P)-dependent dehydrogenase (short-subunit alcohol dehydrogenase family)
MLLRDKVVIISGIGPGLGVKLAVEAAREGARGIVLGARSEAHLTDAEQRIRAIGASGQVLSVPTDIRDAQHCERLAAAAYDKFGRIDGLVNSAASHGPMLPITDDDLTSWRADYETNVIGSVQLTKAVALRMKKHGGGAVAMINTMATMKPFMGEAGYAAAKAALLVASKYLAIELGPHNIRINSIRMGWMWGVPVQTYVSYMSKEKGVAEDDLKRAITANIPLSRIVTDDECARAALFLVSDYSSGMTGSVLDSNGGEALP